AIKKRFPNIKIIVTSGFDEITYMPRAKQLGANAFVYKSKSLRHFGEVARRVLGGEYVFPESKIIPTPQGESPLTEREMEVLALMCRHMSAKQIAEELYITERTVKFHRENMLAKTGFSNGLDLAFYVISNGWINPNF
ncbi:MAG: response regulator transcription factor, partial [Oscillospiraceae bacterium]|nr:response regulator transcription factor [Oscillospiraceae bacterium]